MNPQQVRRPGALFGITLLLAAALWLPATSTAAAATSTTFSGQATALSGTLPVVGTITVVDTGPLAAGTTQANLEQSGACYAAPDAGNCLLNPPVLTGNTLSAVVLHATVIASGDTSRAEASVANLKLNVAGQEIGADLLYARAQATCTGNGAVVKAGAETSVTINGTKYTVAAGETRRVELLDALGVNIGYVVINEGASGPKSGTSIDASALRVVIPVAGVDLTVAKVHADVICGSLMNCPGRNSFVTGGGFIGDKQHFAVAGRDADYWGHVLYQPTSLHVKNPYAVVFTRLSDLDAALKASKFNFTTSMLDAQPGAFEGAAILTWKDQAGSVLGEALAIDMGEPGNQPKGSDYFELASPTASIAGGFLQGGNIQMHGKC